MDTQGRPASRDLIIEEIVARTGIGEAMIERLVRAFYGRARLDPFIGPIFESKVSDWDCHIARICAFWSSVALMSGRYHGQPMTAHLSLPIGTAHFDRWLEISAETAQEVCPRLRRRISSSERTASPTASNWELQPTKERSARNASGQRKPRTSTDVSGLIIRLRAGQKRANKVPTNR